MIHLEVKYLPKVALGLEDTLKNYCDYKNFSLCHLLWAPVFDFSMHGINMW